jgi:hypothetical protein
MPSGFDDDADVFAEVFQTIQRFIDGLGVEGNAACDNVGEVQLSDPGEVEKPWNFAGEMI